LEKISENLSFGGVQYVYQHASRTTNCAMRFALFLPPQAKHGRVPLIWYLSGLTCSHQNVMDKGEYRRRAAELGLAIICPDTSPRGSNVPDEADNWQFGQGAGFYLDATEPPYDRHYRMYSYIIQELPQLVAEHFPVDMGRQSIFGHSMGGHGAITIALKNPGRFKSISAFAPIAQPSTADWSRPALEKYLGKDEQSWRAYDATLLIEDGFRLDNLLVDQGSADSFLREGLRPHLLVEACLKANIPIELNMCEGYDHSYFFISTFMENHLNWHHQHLTR